MTTSRCETKVLQMHHFFAKISMNKPGRDLYCAFLLSLCSMNSLGCYTCSIQWIDMVIFHFGNLPVHSSHLMKARSLQSNTPWVYLCWKSWYWQFVMFIGTGWACAFLHSQTQQPRRPPIKLWCNVKAKSCGKNVCHPIFYFVPPYCHNTIVTL